MNESSLATNHMIQRLSHLTERTRRMEKSLFSERRGVLHYFLVNQTLVPGASFCLIECDYPNDEEDQTAECKVAH